MTEPVSLDEAKLHLRVDDTADDSLITPLITAAREHVEKFIKRPVPWQDEAGADVAVPASIKVAILLIVGDLYANREGQFVGVARVHNPTLDRLLWPYRELAVA
ncbi:head-tail connector protein [Dyella sp. KRB-257]|uniref:head-tail connector protein n=1 Tax=Dyella sp. KRB-257 TaxID=3400915 RepID=UPI003C0BDDEC